MEIPTVSEQRGAGGCCSGPGVCACSARRVEEAQLEDPPIPTPLDLYPLMVGAHVPTEKQQPYSLGGYSSEEAVPPGVQASAGFGTMSGTGDPRITLAFPWQPLVPSTRHGGRDRQELAVSYHGTVGTRGLYVRRCQAVFEMPCHLGESYGVGFSAEFTVVCVMWPIFLAASNQSVR